MCYIQLDEKMFEDACSRKESNGISAFSPSGLMSLKSKQCLVCRTNDPETYRHIPNDLTDCLPLYYEVTISIIQCDYV